MPALSEPVTTAYASPLGPLLLATTDRGLSGLWFEGQRHWPAGAAGWRKQPAHTLLQRACRALDDYFAGARASTSDLPLDLSQGTDFQQQVWQALLSIPAGSTLSYAALAGRIGVPAAARAVGAAVGRNPVSIFVPCHRVVGTGGALTGYAGGLERKTALLRLEGGLP